MVLAAKAERLTSDLAQSNAVIQQMAEGDINEGNLPINPHILQSMGVQVHRGNADDMRVEGGLRPNMCPINFHKAWKTTAFKANFMYKPVL